MPDIVDTQPLTDLKSAESSLRQRLQQEPENFFLFYDLANVLIEASRIDEARHILTIGVQVLSKVYEPKMPSATAAVLSDFKICLAKFYGMIGATWHYQLDYPKAIGFYDKSLQLKPDTGLQFDYSICLERMDQLPQAVAMMHEIALTNPDDHFVVIRLHHLQRQMCDWADYQNRELQFQKAMQQRERFLAIMCGNQTIYEMDEAKVLSVGQFISQAIEQRVRNFHLKKEYQFDQTPKTKLRIGYLSCDIHNHATAHLMFGLWSHHNRTHFEIFTYCYSVPDDSYYRRRIIEDSDQFLTILGWSDDAVADRIYADEIDILVDLKGYTNNHKMEVLALRPAPIIATYLGYPGTTGAQFIDYNIVDKIVVPPEAAGFYTEKLAYLPECYQVNSDEQPIASEKPSRAQLGLPDDAIVYACFNAPYKLTPEIFEHWMNILEAVPKSVLWLYAPKLVTQNNLKAVAALRGFTDRLYFAPHASKPEHLARLQQADLFLDTLPCNAHTTASDALWAGVPVLTCKGNHFASRVASSLLVNVGLTELITMNLEDYEQLAIELGQNPEQLAALKLKLAKNKHTEPLFNTKKFAENIESIYSKMWAIYLAGESPKEID